MSRKNSYDDVEYQGSAIAECDPLQMATIGRLFGLSPADPLTSDVLDLGCGDGINLLSLATAYPGIHAVGFDPAAVAIARGERWRQGAGLDNLTLLSEIDDHALDNTADYVMAHGVLSWIDDEPRQNVIQTAARAVRPGGLVTFSYRAFPHAHYQWVGRDMALDAIAIAEERAEAAGEELTHHDAARIAIQRMRLASTTADLRTAHGMQMAVEADKMEKLPAWFAHHDDLAGVLAPFRITQVVQWCAAQGLQYVGELIPQDLWQYRLRPNVAAIIREQAGPNALRRQQLVDDLINGVFHNSLFVRSTEVPPLEPSAKGLTIYVRQYPNGTEDGVQLSDAISAPVAQVLREHANEAITIEAIAEELDHDVDEITDTVLRLYARGLARISTSPPPVPADPGEFPRASPLVQVQIGDGKAVVLTRFHLPLTYQSTIHRVLISLLDGTRDRDAIRRDLPAAAAAAGATHGLDEVLENLDTVLEAAAIDGLLMPPIGA